MPGMMKDVKSFGEFRKISTQRKESQRKAELNHFQNKPEKKFSIKSSMKSSRGNMSPFSQSPIRKGASTK